MQILSFTCSPWRCPSLAETCKINIYLFTYYFKIRIARRDRSGAIYYEGYYATKWMICDLLMIQYLTCNNKILTRNIKLTGVDNFPSENWHWNLPQKLHFEVSILSRLITYPSGLSLNLLHCQAVLHRVWFLSVSKHGFWFSVVSKSYLKGDSCVLMADQQMWPALLRWHSDTVCVGREEVGFGGMTEIKYWANEERWGPDTV